MNDKEYMPSPLGRFKFEASNEDSSIIEKESLHLVSKMYNKMIESYEDTKK